MSNQVKLRRILIDCSFINFEGQPSGIPRVVQAYIDVGYEWGLKNNIAVIPVVPTTSGVFIVRPLPGQNPPNNLTKAIRPTNDFSYMPLIRSFLVNIQHSVLFSLYHLVFFFIFLLNLRSLWPFDERIRDKMISKLNNNLNSISNEPEASIKIVPKKGDLMFCPAYWHDIDPNIYRELKNKGVKIVTLVHDVLPILFENYYNAPWRYLFRDNLHAAFGYADALFCVSNYTNAALKEIQHRNRLKKLKIITTYNGFEPLTDPEYLEDYSSGLTQPLFLNSAIKKLFSDESKPLIMVGSIEPKKGHIPAIKCLEQMWQAGYERKMVIVGRNAWMSERIVAAIQSSDFYQKKLFWFDNLSDFDLAYVYTKSHALVFCSVGEGFGIPMIEASYYGKPTVLYDTLIAREILGDRGLYFNDSRGFVDQLVGLENKDDYEVACETSTMLNWPTWSSYTPKIFTTMKLLYEGADIPSVIK